jgi:hypothetical protein
MNRNVSMASVIQSWGPKCKLCLIRRAQPCSAKVSDHLLPAMIQSTANRKQGYASLVCLQKQKTPPQMSVRNSDPLQKSQMHTKLSIFILNQCPSAAT